MMKTLDLKKKIMKKNSSGNGYKIEKNQQRDENMQCQSYCT